MNDTGIAGYREFLARRDGEPDLLHRRLDRREEFFSALLADPIRAAHPIDREVFLRNLRRRRPEPGLDPKTLFLLATAKLNQAERFGVDLGDTYGHIGKVGDPPERIYIALEEFYHTRLLAYVLDMFDLPYQVVVPPFVLRQFVKVNVIVPERFRFAFVGAAEMVGCVMFDELRRAGVGLFADEPEVADRIGRLYDEILTDEIGHVGYCAAQCSSAERAVMRRLYPWVGRAFMRQTPEVVALVGAERLRARFAAPFDVAALRAELPNETFLAALP